MSPNAPGIPPTLYHYTSQKGLLGMVKERRLRLTDIRYMNDATEFSLAVGLLGHRVQELLATGALDQSAGKFLQKVLDGTRYSIGVDPLMGFAGALSLSEKPDQLSQWRGYCPREGGYAIGFDGSRLDALGDDTVRLKRCLYDAKEISEQLELFVTRCVEMGRRVSEERDRREFLERAADFAFAFTEFAAWVKHESFREEAEWRLVARLRTRVPEFREGTSTLLPYIVVPPEDGGPLPIARIVVGPIQHSRLAIAAVRSLLGSEGLNDVEVVPSGVPFRIL